MSHQERHYLFQYPEVIDQKTGQRIGFLADVSEGGLMFISEDDIPLEQELAVSFKTFNDDTEQETSIPATIKTCWHKPNINPELNCIGCQFVEIDENDKLWLENLGVNLDNVEIIRTQHE